MTKGYTKEEIIHLLHIYSQENNGILNLEIYRRKKYKPSETTIRKKFGSWNEALNQSNLPINRLVDKWYTKEDIIQFLKKISVNEKTITANEYQKKYPTPSLDTIIALFGSWNGAIQAASLTENQLYLNSDKMIERIRSFAKVHSHNITSEHYMKVKWKPSYTSITNRFGSWIHALELAGIENNYRYYSDEDIFDELNRCMNKIYPQKLTMEKYKSLGNKPSCHTIYKRFGSWKKALHLAKNFSNNKS